MEDYKIVTFFLKKNYLCTLACQQLEETQTHKKKTKKRYIIAYSLLFLIILILILIQLSVVQSFLLRTVTDNLSKKLDTKIEFDSFYFSPFSGLSLSNLYIEDRSKDTLLYVESLSVSSIEPDSSWTHIKLGNVTLENAFYNLYGIDTSEQTNMQFIIDYFANDTDTTSSNFVIESEHLLCDDVRFKYKGFDWQPTDNINFKDIFVTNLNLEAQNICVIKDSIIADVKDLSIAEKSGFKVQHLIGETTVSSSIIQINKLSVRTPNSHILTDKFAMHYPNWGSMSDFVDKVKFDVDLRMSNIHTDDIYYFASPFKNIKLPIYAKGSVKGSIRRLKSKRFFMSLGEQSQIETQFNSSGLPDINDAFINLKIKKMQINVKDIEAYIASLKNDPEFRLPETLHRLKEFEYKGNITGFLNDLVAYGTFQNPQGMIKTDMRFKRNPKNENLLFSGKLSTHELDLLALNVVDTIFGNISMNSMLNLEVDAQKRMKGQIRAEISDLDIQKYRYHGISLNANLENEILVSQASVRDTNLNLSVNSSIDFSKKDIHYVIDGQLKKAYLSNLNLYKDHSDINLSFDVNADFKNTTIKTFNGFVNLSNVSCQEGDKRAFIKKCFLESRIDDTYRMVTLQSDIADANISGNFDSKELTRHLGNIYAQALPSLQFEEPTENSNEQDLKLDLKIKKTKDVLDIFYPQLYISENSSVRVDYISSPEFLTAQIQSDTCVFSGIAMYNINSNIDKTAEGIQANVKTDELFVSEDLQLHHIDLSNKLHQDTLVSALKWGKDAAAKPLANIQSNMFLFPSQKDSISLDVSILPSYLHIEDSVWLLKKSTIKMRGSEISFDSLMMYHQNQFIYANGMVNQSETDSLDIQLSDINLDNFPIIQKKAGFAIDGTVNGKLTVGTHQKQHWLSGYLNVDTAKLNHRLLGNVSLKTQWVPKEGVVKLKLDNTIGRKNFRTIDAQGIIDLRNKAMDIGVQVNRQKMAFFEPFLEGYISNMKGYASGSMYLNSKKGNLEYGGKILFQKASFSVDYLKTHYNFTHTVDFNQSEIRIDNLNVFEVNGLGNSANINGKIYHKNFDEMRFDVNAKLNNFMILNTKFSDNELYYGTGFATGFVELEGTPENTILNISATTEKETKFYIPISDSEEASGADFISFKSRSKTSRRKKEEEYKVNLSGFKIDMDFNVTPDAEAQIIFDEQLGDIIKANGNGFLKIEVNSQGLFTIAGEYTIEKGDYLFTLQNVINKKFKIQNGGSIKWNGNPYDAYVDIDAIYRLKTPIYDLTLDPNDRERIPVECHLGMKKSLMSPDINFEIKFPSSGDRAQGLINSMAPDEKNKQLLSLLLLSRFHTPDYLRGGEETGSGNAVGKNASELLSNQLSNWLSGLSDDFDIGINYHPGDEISNNELEVALSTQLFNDRVAIDGNVGVGEYNNTDANVVGSVNVDVKLNKKGNVRIRGFNRANENNLENNSLYTQGVGLYYKEDFDTFGELLRKYWAVFSRKKKKSTQ